MILFIQSVLVLILALIVLFILVQALLRIIRYFYPFPIHPWMTGLIDNPLRRKIQPPEALVADHGIQPGMQVLEIGPGRGSYSFAAARHLGAGGSLVALDIQEGVLQAFNQNPARGEFENISTLVADVHRLPFPTGMFDGIRMIAVFNEIPDQQDMLAEFSRVLRPEGIFSCSELLIDPDYPLAKNLIHLVQTAGFQLIQKTGNLIRYSVRFQKTD